MDNKTDILILTATFGLGHISVSHAIKEYIELNNKDLSVDIIDIMEILNPIMYKGLYKGYELFIKTNSKLYNYFYYKKIYKESLQVEEVIYKLYLPKFARYILRRQPKLIISTFPICSGFVSKYKEKYKDKIPLITCITDVVDNWEWIHPQTDIYFVATKDLKEKLINKGINELSIKVTGIPIRKQFIYKNKNIESLYSQLGIKKEDFVITVMGGGMGILPEDKEFYQWLNNLKDIKTIILVGKNEELYKKLKESNQFNNLIVLGYVDNVSKIMEVTDILVTKPGGVTLFEAIASCLPVIVYKPVLGQEIENSKFVLEKRIGYVAYNIEELKSKITELLYERRKIDYIKGNISNLSKDINIKILIDTVFRLYGSQKNKRNNTSYYEIS